MAELTIEHVIVPLDGSAFAERALSVAAGLVAPFGATIELMAVADSDSEEAHLRDYLTALRSRTSPAPGSVDVYRDDDPADRIAAVEREREPSVVCLATHGRGRSAALLGSVARRALTISGEPMVLAGPLAEPGIGEGPVVACIDGSPDGEDLIPTAGAWATALGRGLVLVTVAEPVPEPMRAGDTYRRRHGPQVDADRYVDDLVTQTREHQPDLSVSGHAVYDPISPEDGLRAWLATQQVGLLVVASRSRRRLTQAVVGSTAAAIVRHSLVPVLTIRRL
jgi:nucleotide-binding universal stress UspA family protein